MDHYHPKWSYQTGSKIVDRGKCPECPSSDAYISYEDGHAHCYSCAHHVHPQSTIEMVKSSLTQGKNISVLNRVELPSDFSLHHIPDHARDWLLKYQINDKEMRRQSIGYSEKKESLIFPVMGHAFRDGGSDCYMYQSRYFGDDEKTPKWKTVGKHNNMIHLPDKWPHDILVVVEDIVSAIKVSRITNACPMFGTYFSLNMMNQLVKEYKKVRIWLDPDAQVKAIGLSLQLAEYGISTTTILTPHDPKDYVTADIRRIVDPLRPD